MPHDLRGAEIRPGDIVSMDFKVKLITNSEDFCNVTLESCLPMTSGGVDRLTISQVNTRQVFKKS
jgi:hypothetical protein